MTGAWPVMPEKMRKAQIVQHLICIGRAAVPRRRKDGRKEFVEGGFQQRFTARNIIELLGIGTTDAKFTFTTFHFVVGVNPAVLIQFDQVRCKALVVGNQPRAGIGQ